MDPYLERGTIWTDVHHRLLTAIGDTLASQVAPAYFVAIGQRTYVIEADRHEAVRLPDVAVIAGATGMGPMQATGTTMAVVDAEQTVTLPLYEEIQEGYLEIRDVQTHQVITAIELLSPINKIAGAGRDEYEVKRRQVLQTWTNLVEIDLLRGGRPMEMQPTPASDYRVLVARAWERPQARLHTLSVRQPLPELSVPLREKEQEARLPLGQILTEVYDRARYDLRLDYRQSPPEPRFSPEDAAWMEELLQGKGLRG
jgi:hypothetical protein